jgi:hypothetical protein
MPIPLASPAQTTHTNGVGRDCRQKATTTMTTTTIDISTLSEDAAEQIARILIEDGEELLANVLIRYHGVSAIVADNGDGEMETCSDTLRAAAQEYVDGGSWGDDITSTTWVHVHAWTRYVLGEMTLDDDDREDFAIAVDPEEPECSESDHEWESPREVVGGCESSPGVFGHGGGVICREVCAHCGALKVIDTWAQCPETGEQGLTSVHYERAGRHDYFDAWESWKEERDA